MPRFTSRGFKMFNQKIKLPPVGVEPITLTIASLGSNALLTVPSHYLVIRLNL